MGFFEDIFTKGKLGAYNGVDYLGNLVFSPPGWSGVVKPAIEQAVPFWMRKAGEFAQSPTGLGLASDPASLAAAGQDLIEKSQKISDVTEQQREAQEAQVKQLTQKPVTSFPKPAAPPPSAPAPATSSSDAVTKQQPTRPESARSVWEPGFDEGTGQDLMPRERVVEWRKKALTDARSQAGPFAVRAGRSTPTFNAGDAGLQAAAEYEGPTDVFTNRVGPQRPSAGGFSPSEKVPPATGSFEDFQANLAKVTNPLVREQAMEERSKLAGLTREEAQNAYLAGQAKLLGAQAEATISPEDRQRLELNYYNTAQEMVRQIPEVKARLEQLEKERPQKAAMLMPKLFPKLKDPNSIEYKQQLSALIERVRQKDLESLGLQPPTTHDLITQSGGAIGAKYAGSPYAQFGSLPSATGNAPTNFPQ